MRLNEDCNRDILLSLGTPYRQPLRLDDPKFDRYSDDEIFYSLLQLADHGGENGYIRLTYPVIPSAGRKNSVFAVLTQKGRTVLESIRSDELWAKAQVMQAKIGGGGLFFIAGVLSELPGKQIGDHFCGDVFENGE